MISEEKMNHILHLLINGVENSGMAAFPDKDSAIRESRKLSFNYLSRASKVSDLVRAKIGTLKSPPQEYSVQWETLYQKYYEEEMKKLGG